MKFRIVVAVLVFIVQVLLAVTPFVPITAQYWHTSDPQQFYGVLGTFVGIELILLTAAITLILLSESNEASRRFSEMKSALPGATVKSLTDYEFYAEFRAAAELARNSVNIAYFAPYPPDDVTSKERKRYDDEIVSVMKRNTKVNFRRIIRDSARNRPWVSELIQALKQRGNINLALLTCDLPPDQHDMPLSLSIQTIDKDKAWIVAAKSHQAEGEFRDVYIENSTVATAMTDYYDRLWEKSVLLLDHGRLTADAEALLASVAQ